MVLKQLARDYERKRQKLMHFMRKGLTKSKTCDINEQLAEVKRIIVTLRSGKTLHKIFAEYERRAKTLIRNRSSKCVLLEVQNFLRAIAYAVESDTRLKVPLKSEKIELSKERDIRKAYNEKVKPLIDDFLSEEY